MGLTKKEKNALKRWLAEHNIKTECAVCGSVSGWEVHDGIIVGLDVDLKNKQAKPSSAGFFATACKECRYVRFFAAAPIVGMSP